MTTDDADVIFIFRYCSSGLVTAKYTRLYDAICVRKFVTNCPKSNLTLMVN